MTELLETFNKMVEYYGQTNSSILLAVLVILYSVFTINKNYSSLIKKYLENRFKEKEELHEKARQYRKNVNPKIRAELSKVAEDIGADRTLVFEFSNGSSNLIGLPFLYLSATGEMIGADVAPVSHQYQKLNTSIVAHFLEVLEDKGYFYIENIEDIEKKYPIVYGFMKPNGVKTALFYSLYGAECTLGFLVATTVGDNTFTRDNALPKLARAAQKISSLLNYNELTDEL